MAKKSFLVNIDLNQNQLLNPVLQNLATDPASPVTGQFFYNSTANKPKYWNGSAWTLYDAGNEPTITAGTTSQYFRGDKSWQTLNTSAVAEGSNLYYTWSRVNTQIGNYVGNISGVTSLGVSGNLNVTGTTSIKGDTYIGTGTTMSGYKLYVDGLTYLNGDVTVGGSMSFDQNLNIGGWMAAAGGWKNDLNPTADNSFNFGIGSKRWANVNAMTGTFDTSLSVGGTSVALTASPTFTTSIIAGSASMDIFNTTATVVNAFGAATGLTIGSTAGTTTVRNSLTVTGDLTVNGTTTTINATTVNVDDKNIELGSIASPTNTTADGGGITLKGATDKTFNWINATSGWTSSEHLDLVSGKSYRIAGSDVVSVNGTSTTFGGVNGLIMNNTNRTITSGIWNGSVIPVAYGGTGYNSGQITRKVTGTITGGTTSFTVVHGFSIGVVAQVYETSSGQVVDCEIVTASAGTTVFNFNIAPSSGYYSYCIIG